MIYNDRARKLLSLLRIPELDNITLLEAIDYMEIYPSSKIKHFKALSEKSGIPCHEMLFFDDEQRNREVAKLGVHFVLVDSRTGITPTQFENALDAFEKNAGRKQTSMHDYLNKKVVQPLFENYIHTFVFCFFFFFLHLRI